MSDALDRLVEVMDRLRSPGGCPWDRAQTHASLVPFLLEESHELAEAVDDDDRAGLREELGDVLLQVVFHARIAAEHPDDPFDLDDVADTLVAKLVHRHPHVFAGTQVADDQLYTQWDRLKRVEKPARTSALDGVPGSLPALARAQKLAARARRAGVPLPDVPGSDGLASDATGPKAAWSDATGSDVPGSDATGPDATGPGAVGDDGDRLLGEALLSLALHHPDLDAEGALRRATRAWEQRIRAVEQR